jgi:hypothetical protein
MCPVFNVVFGVRRTLQTLSFERTKKRLLTHLWFTGVRRPIGYERRKGRLQPVRRSPKLIKLPVLSHGAFHGHAISAI